MTNEKARLEKMLRDNKISQQDYEILASALKRKTIFNKIHSTFLLNPFQKIAGIKALVLGLITLLLTSFFGVKAQVYYLSSMVTLNATALAKQTISHPFAFLLYQNVACWFVLATLLMIAAKILQKNKIRIIDFFGTVALARFPTLIITLYVMIGRAIAPNLWNIDMSKGFPLHFSASQYLVSIPASIIAIWQAVIYFYAYKESSGLTGKKLWLSFLGTMVIAECIAQPVTTFFMS